MSCYRSFDLRLCDLQWEPAIVAFEPVLVDPGDRSIMTTTRKKMMMMTSLLLYMTVNQENTAMIMINGSG